MSYIIRRGITCLDVWAWKPGVRAVSGEANDISWKELFVKAIVSYLMDDENSPNEIDEKETEWLYNKIKGDGTIDETEKELLLALKSRAKMFPSRLEELL